MKEDIIEIRKVKLQAAVMPIVKEVKESFTFYEQTWKELMLVEKEFELCKTQEEKDKILPENLQGISSVSVGYNTEIYKKFLALKELLDEIGAVLSGIRSFANNETYEFIKDALDNKGLLNYDINKFI